MRDIFLPQGGPRLSARLTKKFIIFYIFDLGIKMCTIKFSIEFNIFQIDDRDTP